MKIRVTSDLHIDVNDTMEFGFHKGVNDVDLNIIAGDIAGDYILESNYLSKLNSDSQVVCVAGNHLGYNYLYRKNRFENPLDGTKEDSLLKLRKNCSFKNIHYLENEYILVDGKIVFGGTMYSDFNLYNDPEYAISFGQNILNDFRYVYTYDGECIRPMTGDDYISKFNSFMNKLQECINVTNEDGLDIIVVTHFAPSAGSISEKYNGGKYKDLNPCYASNLNKFIEDNPRIKLWVHGHMHDSFDYWVGTCRVVCCPYGYYGREQFLKPESYNGKVIEI